MSSHMPRSRLTSTRSRRQRLAAGAVLAASGLLGTYLAAIRPQPTYASPNTGSQFGQGMLSPSSSGVCPIADDTTVYDDTSLQTAIAQSSDDSVICIGASITLSSELVIDDTTLTITGRSDSDVTINLGGNKRFINANLGGAGDDTLTIRNLTIENGYVDGSGGAIRVQGNGALRVESSRFVGNEAYDNGGAIWSAVPLEVGDSHFTNNRTPNVGYVGGAIYAYSALEVIGSSFTGNHSHYKGGAIYAYSALEVSGSSFTGNYSVGYGGAIYSEFSDGLMIRDSEFISNTSNFDGGAISSRAPLTVHNSKFTGNVSNDDAGAILADDTLAVSGSSFARNAATSGRGGAIVAWDPADISTSAFVNNYSDSRGGAVFANGSISVEDCLFDGNDAASYGAALYIDGFTGSASRVTSSSFIVNGDDTAPRYGGGVYKGAGDLVISNSLFWGNKASIGGALGLANNTFDDTITYTTIAYNGALTSSGGIYVGAGSSSPRVNIHNSILFGNLVGASGSDVVSNGADVTMRNSTYTDANSLSGVTVDATSVAGDPLLPQPSNNGGPVIGSDDSTTYLPTTIPGIGSPAIGIADPSLLPEVTVDQIGATRTSRTAGSMNVAPPTPPQPTFPPSAPLSVTGQAGSSSATVTWATPTSAGSFPITDYQAIVAPGGQTCLVQAPATRCTITGLTNGTTYTAIVRALNGAGWSTWSDPSEPFTPVKPVEKSILITGTRAQIDGRSGVRVLGETTGLVGATVQARVHLSGEVDYYDGSRRTVADDGTFTWQRFTNKKVYVYFRDADDPTVRSNRIIIPIR